MMRYVETKVLKHALSEERKKEMTANVTETAAEIEARPSPGENLQPQVWGVIEAATGR